MRSTRFRARGLRRWHPAAWAAVMVLAVGAAEAAPVSSRLVALRKASGAPVATHTLWRTAEGAAGAPTVAGGWAFFVEEGKTLCAMNLKTGKVAWKAELDAPTRLAPLVVGATILAFGTESLAAFTATTGRALWSLSVRELGDEWLIGPETRMLPAKDRLVLCSAKALLCVDLKNGQPIWAMRRPHGMEPAPVIVDRFLYVRDGKDATAWARYLLTDGSDARDEVNYGPLKPEVATRKERGSRVFLSADRRTLTVLSSGRPITYRAPEPFTIAGVVGETADVLCVQIVARGPGAPGKG